MTGTDKEAILVADKLLNNLNDDYPAFIEYTLYSLIRVYLEAAYRAGVEDTKIKDTVVFAGCEETKQKVYTYREPTNWLDRIKNMPMFGDKSE